MPGGAPGSTRRSARRACPADPADRTTVPITKPGLGMSADYGLPPTPNTSLPNPQGKSKESLEYSAAGVDSGEIVIRGGSHLDFSFIPNQAFGASLRGPDMVDWYTSAWFDKYLKHERRADQRLLTNRWREEPMVADRPQPGRQRVLVLLLVAARHPPVDGEKWDCEDLRNGCPGITSNDGYQGVYSYAAIDNTPEG